MPGAREKDSSAAPSRPRWTSPIWPLLLLVAGVGMLFVDGLRPYRIWWRRAHWRQTQGVLLKSYERRRVYRMTKRADAEEYVARRPQKLVYEEVVRRGWPIPRRLKVYKVRLHYSYFVGKRKHIRLADSPPREFDSREAAQRFLQRFLREKKLRIWVDPEHPARATAFLMDPPSVKWVYWGAGLVVVALLWLLAALIVGHRLSRRGGEEALVSGRSRSQKA